MKRRIFLVCLFYCFFRLPNYESIAAIFWQSASYVSVLLRPFDFTPGSFGDFYLSAAEFASVLKMSNLKKSW